MAYIIAKAIIGLRQHGLEIDSAVAAMTASG
jgi:biotin operon repressor